MSESKFTQGRERVVKQKVDALVGKTSDASEEEVARDLVEYELIDFYKVFDARFFRSDDASSSAPHEYERILRRESLLFALSGERSVTQIPEAIFIKLFELVKNEIKFFGQISKHNALNSSSKLLEAAELSKFDEIHLGYVGGRIQNHLYRFLLPEVYDKTLAAEIKAINPELKPLHSVCKAFASEYLQYVQTMKHPTEEDADRIRWMIGLEGMDVVVFWTLAPYVHDELKREGFSSHEAMAKVFDWIREGERLTKENRDENRTRVNLPFAHFPDGRQSFGKFVLGVDERMPTHLLARLYAKNVVEQMLESKF